MANGTITFEKDSYLQGKIEWSSSSNGSVDNSSSVTATLYARRTNSYETYGKTWDGYISIDGSKYSWNTLSSTTYVSNSWVKIKSYTKTVDHDEDGTKSITIAGSISGPDSTQLADAYSKGSATVDLDDIPRQATLSAASNFTDEDEDKPTITYSNPAGDKVDKLEIGIFDEKGETKYVDYREIPKTGDENSTTDLSYTFSLTEDERNALREAAKSNTLSVGFYLKTTIGGTAITQFSSIVKTLSLVNHTPIVEPSVVDINETTLVLTGDKFKLIRYHSSAYAVINARARKYANITGQRITNGQTSVSGGTAQFDNIGSNSFVFYAKDSRNNAVTKTINVSLSWIDYIHLSCNTKPSNPTAEGDMVLNISGNYWNGNFGATNNELTLQYRMTADGVDFGDWVTVIPTITNNTYDIDIPISDLDYQTNYKFEVKASDKLEETPIKKFNVQTKTIFDWSDEDFQFNVPVYADNISGSRNIFDGTLEVGSYDSNTGDKTVLEGQFRNAYPVKIEPNTTYTISVNGVAHRFVVLFYDKNKNFLSEIRDNTTGTITSPENAKYLNFRCFSDDYSDEYSSYKIQIESGNTVTAYGNNMNYGYKFSDLVNLLHPIGSIYISANPINPSILFGGTWESFGTGRTLVGVDADQTEFATVEQIGGSKELQAHVHDFETTTTSKELTGYWYNNSARFKSTNYFSGIVTNRRMEVTGYWSETGGTDTNSVGFNIDARHEHSGTTKSTGLGDSGNLQPYITVYMWKRIS